MIDLSTLELEAETDVESAVLQIDLDALIRDPVAYAEAFFIDNGIQITRDRSDRALEIGAILAKSV